MCLLLILWLSCDCTVTSPHLSGLKATGLFTFEAGGRGMESLTQGLDDVGLWAGGGKKTVGCSINVHSQSLVVDQRDTSWGRFWCFLATVLFFFFLYLLLPSPLPLFHSALPHLSTQHLRMLNKDPKDLMCMFSQHGACIAPLRGASPLGCVISHHGEMRKQRTFTTVSDSINVCEKWPDFLSLFPPCRPLCCERRRQFRQHKPEWGHPVGCTALPRTEHSSARSAANQMHGKELVCEVWLENTGEDSSEPWRGAEL